MNSKIQQALRVILNMLNSLQLERLGQLKRLETPNDESASKNLREINEILGRIETDVEVAKRKIKQFLRTLQQKDLRSRRLKALQYDEAMIKRLKRNMLSSLKGKSR